MVNAVIGTVQEGRAERSMEALRRLSALKVRGLRGGQEEIIEAHNLVSDDLVLWAEAIRKFFIHCATRAEARA